MFSRCVMAFTQSPEVHPYYDALTNTVCYLVIDAETNACGVIDSVLNFEGGYDVELFWKKK